MLTTIAKVKEYLAIDNTDTDTELTTLLGYSDSAIKSYLGRNIEQAVITNEVLRADGEQKIFFVKEAPIDSGSSVTVTYNTTDYSSSAYEIDYDQGIVFMDSAPERTPTKFTVSYTGGYAAVPGDLEMVAVMLTADLFKAGGGGNASGIGTGSGEVKSEKLGDYSVSYAVADSSSSGITSVMELIKKYESVLGNYKNYNI
jgi:hypothetical protein